MQPTVSEGFGSDPESFCETPQARADRLSAEARQVAGRGNGDGTSQEPQRASEIRVVAENVRWERPTARSFWDALAEPERRALDASGMEKVFHAGSVLCREGDESSQVMIIDSGWAKVSVEVGGGEQIFAVRGPGDVVGERAALMARVRSASVTALDEVRATVVAAERFTEFLLGHPRASEVLDRQVRERREEDRVRHFADELAGAERRLAWLLLELAQSRGGYQQAAPAVFTLPMSQQELADWAEASPDAVARFVRSWQERGIVRTGSRQLSVVDLDGLAAICGAGRASPAAGPRRQRKAGLPGSVPPGSVPPGSVPPGSVRPGRAMLSSTAVAASTAGPTSRLLITSATACRVSGAVPGTEVVTVSGTLP